MLLTVSGATDDDLVALIRTALRKKKKNRERYSLKNKTENITYTHRQTYRQTDTDRHANKHKHKHKHKNGISSTNKNTQGGSNKTTMSRIIATRTRHVARVWEETRQ